MNEASGILVKLKSIHLGKTLFTKYGIYVFLVLLFIIASLASPTFLKPQNLKNIFCQAAPLGMVSIGQTFVILTGRVGLDLSVASIMATVAVIIASTTGGKDVMFLPAVMIGLVFGSLVGLSNGLLITKRRVPPFMATLGMMIIVQGLRFIYTRGAPKGNFPPILRFLGTGDVGFIPISIIFLAIMTGIAAIVLKKTVLGRQIYTIGGNVSAAILSGFNVGFIIIISYVISGFTAGIAGIFLAGWIGISDNWVGRGYELDSIAAVVMGGTSLHGGRGGVWGTIAGVLILIMLYNIVLILHFPSKLQIIVKGIVIIAAASFWSLKRS